MLPAYAGSTCSECSDVAVASESELFRFTDESVGANFPPLHPRCRCQVNPAVTDWDAWARQQMDQERARKAAERFGASELSRKQSNIDNGQPRKPINQDLYHTLVNQVTRRGGQVIRGGEEVTRHLDRAGSGASQVGDTLLFRDNPTTSEVLEEVFHFKQEQRGDYSDIETVGEVVIRREIDAQRYLLSVTDRYGIPDSEVELTKRNLEHYLEKLRRYEGGGSVEDG